MSGREFLSSLEPLIPTAGSVVQVAALALIGAVVLTPAERWAAAQRQPLVWRKGVWLDVVYWFMTPLATRCVTALVLGAVLFAGALCIGLEVIPRSFLVRGFGPLARQPFVLQAFEILLISDFVDYWTHRALHRGRLWRVHAIHHSPEEMNWLSSSRVHPLNDLITRSGQLLPIIALGFPPTAILAVVPLLSFYVMFLHANVKWDFGPLRWVVVSPAFHRWHHASDEEGIDKNFAGIFPVWDVLFGTAHFPRNRLPCRYGLCGRQLPDSLWAHLVYPFPRWKRKVRVWKARRSIANRSAGGSEMAPREQGRGLRPRSEEAPLLERVPGR